MNRLKWLVLEYDNWIAVPSLLVALVIIQGSLFFGGDRFTSYLPWSLPFIAIGMSVMFYSTRVCLKDKHARELREMKARHFIETVELELWKMEVERTLRGDS
jgi:uncharacterized membrane protein